MFTFRKGAVDTSKTKEGRVTTHGGSSVTKPYMLMHAMGKLDILVDWFWSTIQDEQHLN